MLLKCSINERKLLIEIVIYGVIAIFKINSKILNSYFRK